MQLEATFKIILNLDALYTAGDDKICYKQLHSSLRHDTSHKSKLRAHFQVPSQIYLQSFICIIYFEKRR